MTLIRIWTLEWRYQLWDFSLWTILSVIHIVAVDFFFIFFSFFSALPFPACYLPLTFNRLHLIVHFLGLGLLLVLLWCPLADAENNGTLKKVVLILVWILVIVPPSNKSPLETRCLTIRTKSANLWWLRYSSPVFLPVYITKDVF